MPHVGMEYAIMIPILIMQVLILPMSTGWLMTIWTDSRMQLELQDTADHVASTFQQLYFSLNGDEVLPGNVTKTVDLPSTIESHLYYATGSLKTVNSSKILRLHFVMEGTGISTNSSVTMGPNVSWQTSVFMSNRTSACIKVQKSSDVPSVLTFAFG